MHLLFTPAVCPPAVSQLKAMGNPESPHVLTCEWVGTQLARRLGLLIVTINLLSWCGGRPAAAKWRPGALLNVRQTGSAARWKLLSTNGYIPLAEVYQL